MGMIKKFENFDTGLKEDSFYVLRVSYAPKFTPFVKGQLIHLNVQDTLPGNTDYIEDWDCSEEVYSDMALKEVLDYRWPGPWRHKMDLKQNLREDIKEIELNADGAKLEIVELNMILKENEIVDIP